MVEVERNGVAATVTRLRTGCDVAAARLYRLHIGAVRLAVGDNVRDPDTRDDIVQEVFAIAFERVDQLEDSAAFRPWILQIARRRGIDERRRRSRRPTLVPMDGRSPATPHDAVVDRVAAQELGCAIRDGVHTLRHRDRVILTMIVELGFSLEEVATALDLSPQTAKVVLHRARARLRSAVAPALAG